MKKYIILSTFILSSLAYAGESKIRANLEVANGVASRSVYDPKYGVKVSHLDWKIKNIPMIKLGYDYSINNFEFSVTGKKNIKNNIKSGTMKDYDWYSDGRNSDDENDYKHFSTEAEAKAYTEEILRTKGVELKYEDAAEENDDRDGYFSAYYKPDKKNIGTPSNFSETKNYVKDIIDLDFSAKYFVKKTDKFKFAPLIGLSYERYNFYTLGVLKQYNYVPGLDPVYFLHGSSGKKGVEYRQKYITPYLGFNLEYSPTNTFNISFTLKGSSWGKAKGVDNHALRGIIFKEDFKNIKSLVANLQLKYNLNENLNLSLDLEKTRYFERKNAPKDESISLKSTSYSLGFEYKF